MIASFIFLHGLITTQGPPLNTDAYNYRCLVLVETVRHDVRIYAVFEIQFEPDQLFRVLCPLLNSRAPSDRSPPIPLFSD